MKKIFILTSVLALGALSSFAQGTVNGNNGSVAGEFITIQDTTGQIDGGAIVTIGKPATAAGFVGAGPAQVSITLYGAANNTALTTLESATSLLATTLNSPSGVATAQGTVTFGNPFTVVTVGATDEFIAYATAQVNGITYGAWSSEATGISPLTGVGTPPNIFGTISGSGITTFNLIAITPEPSTIALGGLGAAALLLFRRRK